MSGEPHYRNSQLLQLRNAQVENHTAARTCSDIQMNFVSTLGCLGHCFHAYPPNVLVSAIAEKFPFLFQTVAYLPVGPQAGWRDPGSALSQGADSFM